MRDHRCTALLEFCSLTGCCNDIDVLAVLVVGVNGIGGDARIPDVAATSHICLSVRTVALLQEAM